MNRFGAFAVHLSISLVIFGILGSIIVFHWYPDFFFTADGGWQGIRIVAFVDLVLGPVLTLVVFKKGKPSLRFDLTVIATIQFVSLIGGVWVVYSERPLAMVFADGSFQTVTNDDYIEANRPIPDFNEFTDSPPHWISVVLPQDPEAQSKVRKENLVSRRSLRTEADFYKPFHSEHVDLSRDGLTPLEMERIGLDVFQQFAEEHNGTPEDFVFLPFGTRYEQALMALHKKDGSLTYLRIPMERLKADLVPERGIEPRTY